MELNGLSENEHRFIRQMRKVETKSFKIFSRLFNIFILLFLVVLCVLIIVELRQSTDGAISLVTLAACIFWVWWFHRQATENNVKWLEIYGKLTEEQNS